MDTVIRKINDLGYKTANGTPLDADTYANLSEAEVLTARHRSRHLRRSDDVFSLFLSAIV